MLVARADSLKGLDKAKLVVWKALTNERAWEGEWKRGSVLEAPFELGFFTHKAIQDCHKHPRAYEVYLFYGEGEVSNGYERVKVREGDVIIFTPNEKHVVTLERGFGYAILIGEPVKVKLSREACEGRR